jgi:glycosyltransferase involved in cell wall biosynthesis
MRILVLTPRVPWPAIDGGRIAMSRLAESLARAGEEVEILSLDPRNRRGSEGTDAPLPLRTVGIDTARALLPAIRSVRSGSPYVVERFVSRRFRDALRIALRRFDPDIVQIESPFLLPYAATVRSESRSRIVLRALNVEFRIWESLARHETNALRRIALRRVASSLRGYEVGHFETPDAVVAISTADAEDFRALGYRKPIHVAPCGVTLSDLPDAPPEPWRAGFIGSLDFRPNQQAVTWIVNELWPRVTRLAPRATLSIAGSSAPDWLRRHTAGPGVEFHGQVDDSIAFLRRMSVVIAPLFAGGGMRIKVLEAMALSRPVVATPLGAGGIEAEAGRDLVIADGAGSFADAVVRLLREPRTAARVGRQARATVAARYDSDTIARELVGFYASL